MKRAKLVGDNKTISLNLFVSGWGDSKPPVVAGILENDGATKLITGHQIRGTNEFDCEIQDLPGIGTCHEKLDEFIHNNVSRNGLIEGGDQAVLSLISVPEPTSDPLTKSATATMTNFELANQAQGNKVEQPAATNSPQPPTRSLGR